MADIKDYTGKITSQHADKPKYMAMVEAVAQCFVDTNQVAAGLPDDFDLDSAVGAQLDDVGLWVGIGRSVKTPLAGIYFALDIDGLGFDQGAWQGPFDPDTGITLLDDESYRLVIKAKIASNNWDGTMEGTLGVLEIVFPPSSGVLIFVEDNQDMTMTVGASGAQLSSIQLALLTGGYISVKPQSVGIKYYVVPSTPGPMFGFDVNNDYIAGFNTGSWATIITP